MLITNRSLLQQLYSTSFLHLSFLHLSILRLALPEARASGELNLLFGISLPIRFSKITRLQKLVVAYYLVHQANFSNISCPATFCQDRLSEPVS
jgi:hypothetical protein